MRILLILLFKTPRDVKLLLCWLHSGRPREPLPDMLDTACTLRINVFLFPDLERLTKKE